MKKYKVLLEAKTYANAVIYIDADTPDEAMEKARILSPNDPNIDWLSDPFPSDYYVSWVNEEI